MTLTLAELERLALLIEELAEASQAACKVIRFGYEDGHPNRQRTNRQDLERELGDVIGAIARMQNIGDLDSGAIRVQAEFKVNHHCWLRNQNDV